MIVTKRRGRHRANPRRTHVQSLLLRFHPTPLIVQPSRSHRPANTTPAYDVTTWRPLHGSEAAGWHLQPGERTSRAIAAVVPQQRGGEVT